MKSRALRNGLAVLSAGSILILAIGWYQDWYRVERAASAPGFYNLHVGIHTAKVSDDYDYSRDQVNQGGQWIQARWHDLNAESPDAVAGPKAEPHHHDGMEESSHTHTPPAEPVPNKWK